MFEVKGFLELDIVHKDENRIISIEIFCNPKDHYIGFEDHNIVEDINAASTSMNCDVFSGIAGISTT